MSKHTACINMVKQQLRTGDVLNESILSLYSLIPRNEFVPEQFTQLAYSDMQIPLAHGQRMLSPLEEGRILQALDLKGTETVLEIGTGTGFFTALLSKLCKKVISVDYFSNFTANAIHQLQTHHCQNVELITGDGHRGWLENAPYDIIVFTGAIDKLEEIHKLQVLPGGKLFAIEGKSPLMHANLYNLNHNGAWQKTLLFETDIPSLMNQLKPKEFVF